MSRRSSSQGKDLDTRILNYAPPKKIRIVSMDNNHLADASHVLSSAQTVSLAATSTKKQFLLAMLPAMSTSDEATANSCNSRSMGLLSQHEALEAGPTMKGVEIRPLYSTMANRKAYKCKAVEALIQVYAPPKKFRILDWAEEECCSLHILPPAEANDCITTNNQVMLSVDLPGCTAPSGEYMYGSKVTANTCNSRPLDSSTHQPATEADSDQRTEKKQTIKRRWVGTVTEALGDVFTAIWTNFVEPSSEFQTSAQLRPGSTRPGTDATLVSGAFSTAKLLAARESFRVHFQLMLAFNGESVLPDWENNAAVNEYARLLKADPMIRECCQGLYSRLSTAQLETVDQFVTTLRQAWFQPVSAGAPKPRCGYHHVCIGDFSSRGKILSGMHSWFKFLVEEEQKRTRIHNWWSYQKDLHLVSLKFSMRHPTQDTWFTKQRSSFLVGVPTDFELLLFTVITMVNPNQDTIVKIKDFEPLVVVPRSVKKTGSVVTAYFRESPRETSG